MAENKEEQKPTRRPLTIHERWAMDDDIHFLTKEEIEADKESTKKDK